MKNQPRNSYYSAVLRRHNLIKEVISAFALYLCSYPRLLLEVFIRKNFGERYFSMASVVTILVILGIYPYFSMNVFGMESHKIFPEYLGWYVFLAAFLLVSIKRYFEVLNGPSVYDFNKYSLFSGEHHQAFSNIQIGGKKPEIRTIETLYEPALFFILGLVFLLLHQKLGGLLIVSSLLYSLSYFAAYAVGDNYIMDKIDEIISNEEMQNALVEGMDSRDTKYFEMRSRVPKDKRMRQKIASMIAQNNVPVEVE